MTSEDHVAQVLANDRGSYVVQVLGTTPGATYYLRVSPDVFAGADHLTGDYLLGINFQAGSPRGPCGISTQPVLLGRRDVAFGPIGKLDRERVGFLPLAERDEITRQRVDQLGDLVDRELVLSRWEEVLTVASWSGPPLWLHGDLHPANLVVLDGQLSAVIDFGDLTSGDPATDLAVAWMLFPPELRPVFRSAAGDIDDDTWARARGWALSLGIAYIAHSADNSILAQLARRTIDAALAA